MGAKVQIRPGADAELPALVEALGERPFFADRLARQHQGRGVLLVAWPGDRQLALGGGRSVTMGLRWRCRS